MTTRLAMLESMRDLSKDFLGYRLNMDWNSMGDDELKHHYDMMVQGVEEQIEQDKIDDVLSFLSWTERLRKMTADFTITLQTALKWDMEAEDIGEYGLDFYMYLMGIPSSMRPEVDNFLAGK